MDRQQNPAPSAQPDDRPLPAPDLWERRFYAWLARPLLRRLSGKNLSPDQVTVASLLTGVLAVVLIFPMLGYGVNLLGVLLLNLSAVFDALAEQMALRARRPSPLGWFWTALTGQGKLLLVTGALIIVQPNELMTSIGWLFLVLHGLQHHYRHCLAHQGDARLWTTEADPDAEEYADAGLIYRALLRIDEYRLRARLGFLTGGEFCLLVSLGVLCRLTGVTLILLCLYALAGLAYTIAWGGARSAYLAPVLARARAERVVFYLHGAGPAGEKLLANCRRAGLEARLFIDPRPELAGTMLSGLPVLLPADLKPDLPANRMIVIAGEDRHAARRRLLQLGFPDANLLLV